MNQLEPNMKNKDFHLFKWAFFVLTHLYYDTLSADGSKLQGGMELWI